MDQNHLKLKEKHKENTGTKEGKMKKQYKLQTKEIIRHNTRSFRPQKSG